ncbi:Cytochrome B5 isoform D, partial [Cucurbita argyrosperma subsp. argyrosperma]|uniref:Cytochrome b5-like n=2 Tax=Cucurbita TaxID=3660 RepID=A0A6J1E925_CUCMO
MASDPKVFVFDEVAKHNNQQDCWVIISGKVYDVTSLLEDHPGGDEVLLLATERDATDDFEEVGHSLTASEQMEEYYVGNVDMSTLPKAVANRPPAPQSGTATTAAAKPTAAAEPKAAAPTTTTTSSAESPGSLKKVLQVLIPLLILGIAYYMQYYGKKQ